MNDLIYTLFVIIFGILIGLIIGINTKNPIAKNPYVIESITTVQDSYRYSFINENFSLTTKEKYLIGDTLIFTKL